LKLKGKPQGLIKNSSFIFAIPMALRLLFPGPPSHMEGIFTPCPYTDDDLLNVRDRTEDRRERRT
jgi:hypothetical protein